jgi:D-alanyl-D-alanine carboxypeptidase
LLLCTFVMAATPKVGSAAPYAAFVIDARTGEVLHARNADTRLHPASLTKMMTLYIVFQAIERGEISLDTMVTITPEAANEPPSKLGLRAGQQIALRYLIRAAAVKSANDCATAIGIALEGSVPAFAARMNRTAAAMGMTNTTFRNANGLPNNEHLSTARDMTTLGRHVIYDFPQYYNLFSRRSADAGIAQVSNTNRRFLDSYPGADGIKTGFTNAAGFNLVASAQRGNERIIATVFGGTSTAARNARIAELLDMGFARAPANARVNLPPPPPASAGPGPGAASAMPELVATNQSAPGAVGKTIRVTGQLTTSLRPTLRPGPAAEPDLLVADAEVIHNAVAEAIAVAAAETVAEPQATDDTVAEVMAIENVTTDAEAAETEIAAVAPMSGDISPQIRPAEVVVTAAATTTPEPVATRTAEPEVVTRISTSGGRNWGINVGRFGSRYEAERILLRVALNEMSTLDGSLRRVVQRSGGFDANFMGLSRETADLACRRLQARGTTCFMIGSDS